jgi:DNA-binding NarL/FixJ family response regulator
VRGSLEADGFVIVAEVGDARKAVDAAVEHEPDVCVLDIHMPATASTPLGRSPTSSARSRS